MENRQDAIEDDSVEVTEMLKRLEGIKFDHVPDSERGSAVKRTIRLFGINSATELKTIIDLLDTNEGQMGVHADPSDPQD